MYMRARLPMLIMTTGLALLGDTNLRKDLCVSRCQETGVFLDMAGICSTCKQCA